MSTWLPSEIVVTTGGSEAMLFALMACAAPGDEALVVEPFYTNYLAFAAMAGVKLVPLRARGEDGFHLPPPDEWKAALTPRTRLVLLCNPNNPTGTVYTRDEVDAVAAFCREHACSSSPTRSTASSSTTAAARRACSRCRAARTSRCSSTASRSATAPAASGSAAW